MKKCDKELFVEKYFDLLPEATDEKTIIVTDFGQLVNLLAMFENEKLNQTKTKQTEPTNSICHCINWHKNKENTSGKNAVCSYCGRLRTLPQPKNQQNNISMKRRRNKNLCKYRKVFHLKNAFCMLSNPKNTLCYGLCDDFVPLSLLNQQQ